MRYAIVDIETTGDKPKDIKIIEIAIIIHDGVSELDVFHTLVDPEERISPFISRLTGIHDADVDGAPKFYEIARQIVEFTQDTVFVAHNVSFDYGIVRREFKRLGFDYRLHHLCTVQTAKILIPDMESYSLKKITRALGISLDNHHRAIDDTRATAELFKMLYNRGNGSLDTFIKKEINPRVLHPKLNIDEFDEIPNKTGIYKFFSEQGDLIYIGKSIHIKKRVEQHLKNTKTNKALEMRERIAGIKHELTGSELIALLLESEEIKKHQPVYNRAQRNAIFNHGLYMYEDLQGYLNLAIRKKNLTDQPIMTFNSAMSGKSSLEFWLEEYGLCQKLCHLHKSTDGCFKLSLKECNGACIGEESPADYNRRVRQLIDDLNFGGRSFLVVDKGRNSKEFSFIWMFEGQYKGYGFIPRYILRRNKNLFRNHLIPSETNRDFQSIIKLQLEKNKKLEIISL